MEHCHISKKCKETNIKKGLAVVKQRYDFILSRYIGNQRICESDWPKATTAHTKPRLVVLNASFSLWLSPCKILKILIGCFQFYCSWKNPLIWLEWETQQVTPHQKVGVVSFANFPWRLFLCKRINIIIIVITFTFSEKNMFPETKP